MAAGFLRSICLSAAAVLWAGTPAGAWRSEEAGQSTHRMVAQGRALTPNGEADGQLELYSLGAKGGLGRLVFTLYKVAQPEGSSFIDSIKTFHFDEFEGPGAPAAARRLTQVTVRGRRGEVQVRLRQNGYYSAELKGGFVFDSGLPGGKEKLDLQRIFRALRNGGTSLVVRVTDTQDPKVWVQGEFATGGPAGMLRKRLVGR
jgi:hypothetical protein